jgi:hypothetical protein
MHQRIRRARVIADITLLNENVMYEVGYAHGCGLTPLIYTRGAARLKQLPVYFRTLNIQLAGEATPVNILIDVYLRTFKARRSQGRSYGIGEACIDSHPAREAIETNWDHMPGDGWFDR